MRRYFALGIIILLFTVPAAADDAHRLSFLEQEVRRLQREVQVLSRQLDELRVRSASPANPTAVRPEAAASPDLPPWVDAAKWQRVRRGMSELEVIGLLGAPTSIRAENAGRTLLYAMEIGSMTFLSGSVTLTDRGVMAVQAPELK